MLDETLAHLHLQRVEWKLPRVHQTIQFAIPLLFLEVVHLVLVVTVVSRRRLPRLVPRLVGRR